MSLNINEIIKEYDKKKQSEKQSININIDEIIKEYDEKQFVESMFMIEKIAEGINSDASPYYLVPYLVSENFQNTDIKDKKKGLARARDSVFNSPMWPYMSPKDKKEITSFIKDYEDLLDQEHQIKDMVLELGNAQEEEYHAIYDLIKPEGVASYKEGEIKENIKKINQEIAELEKGNLSEDRRKQLATEYKLTGDPDKIEEKYVILAKYKAEKEKEKLLSKAPKTYKSLLSDKYPKLLESATRLYRQTGDIDSAYKHAVDLLPQFQMQENKHYKELMENRQKNPHNLWKNLRVGFAGMYVSGQTIYQSALESAGIKSPQEREFSPKETQMMLAAHTPYIKGDEKGVVDLILEGKVGHALSLLTRNTAQSAPMTALAFSLRGGLPLKNANTISLSAFGAIAGGTALLDELSKQKKETLPSLKSWTKSGIAGVTEAMLEQFEFNNLDRWTNLARDTSRKAFKDSVVKSFMKNLKAGYVDEFQEGFYGQWADYLTNVAYGDTEFTDRNTMNTFVESINGGLTEAWGSPGTMTFGMSTGLIGKYADMKIKNAQMEKLDKKIESLNSLINKYNKSYKDQDQRENIGENISKAVQKLPENIVTQTTEVLNDIEANHDIINLNNDLNEYANAKLNGDSENAQPIRKKILQAIKKNRFKNDDTYGGRTTKEMAIDSLKDIDNASKAVDNLEGVNSVDDYISAIEEGASLFDINKPIMSATIFQAIQKAYQENDEQMSPQMNDEQWTRHQSVIGKINEMQLILDKELKSTLSEIAGVKEDEQEVESAPVHTKTDEEKDSITEAKKAEIERRRQEEKDKYINDRFTRVEGQKNDLESNQEAPLEVGKEYSEGMKVEATRDDVTTDNIEGEGYEIITKVNKPQINTDGVMTQSGEVETIRFDSKKDADTWLEEEKQKAKERRNKKEAEINAKYDAELAALEETQNLDITKSRDKIVSRKAKLPKETAKPKTPSSARASIEADMLSMSKEGSDARSQMHREIAKRHGKERADLLMDMFDLFAERESKRTGISKAEYYDKFEIGEKNEITLKRPYNTRFQRTRLRQHGQIVDHDTEAIRKVVIGLDEAARNSKYPTVEKVVPISQLIAVPYLQARMLEAFEGNEESMKIINDIFDAFHDKYGNSLKISRGIDMSIDSIKKAFYSKGSPKGIYSTEEEAKKIPYDLFERFFTTNFERYMIFGAKSKNNKIQSVFKKLMNWLREIYRAFESSLHPKLLSVFEDMFEKDTIDTTDQRVVSRLDTNQKEWLKENDFSPYIWHYSLTDGEHKDLADALSEAFGVNIVFFVAEFGLQGKIVPIANTIYISADQKSAIPSIFMHEYMHKIELTDEKTLRKFFDMVKKILKRLGGDSVGSLDNHKIMEKLFPSFYDNALKETYTTHFEVLTEIINDYMGLLAHEDVFWEFLKEVTHSDAIGVVAEMINKMSKSGKLMPNDLLIADQRANPQTLMDKTKKEFNDVVKFLTDKMVEDITTRAKHHKKLSEAEMFDKLANELLHSRGMDKNVTLDLRERYKINEKPIKEDIRYSAPEESRKRGYVYDGEKKVFRQEEIPPDKKLVGDELRINFSKDISAVKGRLTIIPSEYLQPSHINKNRNRLHFIQDAQPKGHRKKAYSFKAMDDIAKNLDPDRLSFYTRTAYDGLPTVNTRSEVVQGNNRSAAILHAIENYKGKYDDYVQWLKDNADKIGVSRDEIDKIDNPVLVFMADVSDKKAVQLGQYVASDLETGGVRRISGSTVAMKAQENYATIIDILFSNVSDPDATTREIIRSNAQKTLDYMHKHGYIDASQYYSAINEKGNITADAITDLLSLAEYQLFKNAPVDMDMKYRSMPGRVQNVISKNIIHLGKENDSWNILQDVFESIHAYDEYSMSKAKNFEEWANQEDIFDKVTPRDTYSTLAMWLTEQYVNSNTKGWTASISSKFKKFHDMVAGYEGTIFADRDTTQEDAIKETFGIIPHRGEYNRKALKHKQDQTQEVREVRELRNKSRRNREAVNRFTERTKGKIKRVKLQRSRNIDILFAMRGNKRGSLGMFRELFEDWINKGVERIYVPYGGSFTLFPNLTNLWNRKDGKLKEYHVNIFDKEKYTIVKALQEEEIDTVIAAFQRAIEKFKSVVVEETNGVAEGRSDNEIIGYLQEFIESGGMVGTDDFKKYCIKNNLDALITDETIYALFRKLFQNIMDIYNSEHKELSELENAFVKAIHSMIAIQSQTGQGFIGSSGFKTPFNKILNNDAYINTLKAHKKVLDKTSVDLKIYNKDAVDFINEDTEDSENSGYYLDPPYLSSSFEYADSEISEEQARNMLKFIDPKMFIETHNKIFSPESKAKFAITNDAVEDLLVGIQKKNESSIGYVYKENQTMTLLVASEDSQEAMKEYFDPKHRVKETTAAETEEERELREKAVQKIKNLRFITIRLANEELKKMTDEQYNNFQSVRTPQDTREDLLERLAEKNDMLIEEYKEKMQIIHTIEHITKNIGNKHLKKIVRRIAAQHGKKVASLTPNKLTIQELEMIVDEVRKIEDVVYVWRRGKRIKLITKATYDHITNKYEQMLKDSNITPKSFQMILRQVTGKRTFSEKLLRNTANTAFTISEQQGRGILNRLIFSDIFLSDEAAIDTARSKQDNVLTRELDRMDQEFAKKDKRVRFNVRKHQAESGMRPDISVDYIKQKWEQLLDMRYLYDAIEEATSVPIGRTWKKILEKRNIAQDKLHATLDSIHEGMPINTFKKIIRSEKSMERIELYIASHLPAYFKNVPETPTELSKNEKIIADRISNILNSYKNDIRFQRIISFYLDNKNKDIQSIDDPTLSDMKVVYLPNAPNPAIREAIRIIQEKGLRDLREWSDKQSFGVIRDGYSIIEMFSQRIQRYSKSAYKMSDKHLKSIEKPVYATSSRNIVQRLSSYLRNVTYMKYTRIDIEAFRMMIDSVINYVDDPKLFKYATERNIKTMLGETDYSDIGKDMMMMLFSQAAKTIFLNPKMFVRNILQPIAYDPLLITKLRSVLAHKPTDYEIEYFKKQVTQLRGITHDLLYLDINPFNKIPVIRNINTFASAMNMIAVSDSLNRSITFFTSLAKIKSAIENLEIKNGKILINEKEATIKEFGKMMKKFGFAELTARERYQALETLLIKGKEDFALQWAGNFTKKVHFTYNRYERSTVEQGENKILYNLFVYPKSRAQSLILDLQKFRNIDAEIGKPYAARISATRSITWNIIAGAMIVNSIYSLITGDRRKPYDPLLTMSGYSLGGLALGAINKISELTRLTIIIATDKNKSYYHIRDYAYLLKTLPETFLPFYRQIVQVIEATLGIENIDTTIIKKTFKELGITDYKDKTLEYKYTSRSLKNKIQHFLFGTAGTIVNDIEYRIKNQNFKDIDAIQENVEKMIEVINFNYQTGNITKKEYSQLKKILNKEKNEAIKKLHK